MVEEVRDALSGMRSKSFERMVWTDAVVRYHTNRDGRVLGDALRDFDGNLDEVAVVDVLQREDIVEIVELDAWAVVRDREVFDWMPPSTRTASDYLDVAQYFARREWI